MHVLIILRLQLRGELTSVVFTETTVRMDRFIVTDEIQSVRIKVAGDTPCDQTDCCLTRGSLGPWVRVLQTVGLVKGRVPQYIPVIV